MQKRQQQYSFTWHEIPFVRLLLPLMLGIAAAWCSNWVQPWLFWGVLGGVVLLFVGAARQQAFQYRWFFGLLTTLFLVAFGYYRTLVFNDLNQATHYATLLKKEGNLAVGMVSNVLFQDEEKQRLELTLWEIDSQKCLGTALLYLKADSIEHPLQYGDVIGFSSLKLSATEAPKNPDAFDYKRYLRLKNIDYQGFVKEGEYQFLAQHQGNPIWAFAMQSQAHFLLILKKYLGNGDEFAVGAGLILGYRAVIPDEIMNAYVATGAMHVLSVSGLHVGLLALIIGWLLGKIPLPTPYGTTIKSILQLLLVWLFVLITGASAAALRCSVMYTFMIVGFNMKRRISIYNSLAASAFFILLYNPYSLFDVGFQLSYLGVAGIVFFQPRIVQFTYWIINALAITEEVYAPNARLEKLDKYLIINWFGTKKSYKITHPYLKFLYTCYEKFWFMVIENISVGVAATLVTVALSLYYFRQFPTYFWLSGIVVVPLSAAALGIGLALFIADLGSAFLANLLGNALFYCIKWMNLFLIFIKTYLPYAQLTNLWIGFPSLILLYGILGCMMLAIAQHNIRWIIGGLGLSVLFAINYNVLEYQKYQTNELVIYHIPNATAIDCIDQRQFFSIQSATPDFAASEDSLRYAKRLNNAYFNHRMACHYKQINTFLLDTTVETAHLNLKNHLLQFYNKRLAIVSDALPSPSSSRIKTDYVLIQNHPRLTMEEVTQVFDCQTIIFDGSNYDKSVARWKTQCEALGISAYSTKEKGAFVVVAE
jgi:competence protein ComEC